MDDFNFSSCSAAFLWLHFGSLSFYLCGWQLGFVEFFVGV